MWIRRDRQVIDTTGYILVSNSVIPLLISILVFTFEQFILLELELYLVTLDCKPKLELVVA